MVQRNALIMLPVFLLGSGGCDQLTNPFVQTPAQICAADETIGKLAADAGADDSAFVPEGLAEYIKAFFVREHFRNIVVEHVDEKTGWIDCSAAFAFAEDNPMFLSVVIGDQVNMVEREGGKLFVRMRYRIIPTVDGGKPLVRLSDKQGLAEMLVRAWAASRSSTKPEADDVGGSTDWKAGELSDVVVTTPAQSAGAMPAQSAGAMPAQSAGAMPAPTSVERSDNLLRVGQCFDTKVAEVQARLGEDKGGRTVFDLSSGSAVRFADGHYMVSYDRNPTVERWLKGDAITLCVTELPRDCPPGDLRGIEYEATNKRTGEVWRASDSEHECGGA